MYLAQLIEQSQIQIANWESEIAELQAKILAKQQEIQIYGSVQAAMESADMQLINAVKMLDQFCPDELPGYQELILSRFNAPNPKLIESAADIPAPTPDSAPAPTPQPPTDSTIDVAAIVQAETDSENLEPAKDSASASSYSSILSPQKIKSLEWSTLRKLAKKGGINTKGLTRYEVEQAILSKRLTREDLNRVV